MRSSLLGILILTLCAAPAFGQWDEGGDFAGKKKGKFHGGFAAHISGRTLTLEVSDVEALDDDGVTQIDPTSTSQANTNVDYYTSEIFYGLRGFFEFEAAPHFVLGGHLRAGLLTVDLINELDPGSPFININGNPRNETASGASGEFAFGIGLNVSYEFKKVRFGGEWELAYGTASFEDSRFFDDRIEGSYSSLANRITGKIGYNLGFITPYAQLGILLFSGSADLEEANDDTPDTYDVSFSNLTLIVLGVGAEFQASKHVWGRLSVVFVGETAFEMSLGLRFP